MEARITFSASVIIDGNSIDEINEKWVNMDLFSKEAKSNYAEFGDVLEVVDADTYDTIECDF